LNGFEPGKKGINFLFKKFRPGIIIGKKPQELKITNIPTGGTLKEFQEVF